MATIAVMTDERMKAIKQICAMKPYVRCPECNIIMEYTEFSMSDVQRILRTMLAEMVG